MSPNATPSPIVVAKVFADSFSSVFLAMVGREVSSLRPSSVGGHYEAAPELSPRDGAGTRCLFGCDGHSRGASPRSRRCTGQPRFDAREYPQASDNWNAVRFLRACAHPHRRGSVVIALRSRAHLEAH